MRKPSAKMTTERGGTAGGRAQGGAACLECVTEEATRLPAPEPPLWSARCTLHFHGSFFKEVCRVGAAE